MSWAPKPLVLFAHWLILCFQDGLTPPAIPSAAFGLCGPRPWCPGRGCAPACPPVPSSAPGWSTLSAMAVVKGHLGDLAKVPTKGQQQEPPCHPVPCPGRHPTPWHPTAVGTGSPPTTPSTSRSLQTSCSWHPWLEAWGSLHPCTPLLNLPTPILGAQAAPQCLPLTHLLSGEWHADAVLLDEHGGTGRAGVRPRRGHSSFWGDPRVGALVRFEGAVPGSLHSPSPSPALLRPPRSRHR